MAEKTALLGFGVEMDPREWLDRGVAVVPVFWKSKKPEVAWQRYQTELPSEALVRTWFRPGRKINAAVLCGWQGLTVVDFDTTPAYQEWLDWAAQSGSTVRTVAAQSYRVRTARGMHVYVWCDDRPRTGHFAGGDVKGQGGYVLIPPSVHPSGATYASDDPAAPILRVASINDLLPEPLKQPRPQPLPLTSVAAGSSLYPLTLVEKIKEKVRIEDFVPAVEGRGRWAMACCPFHDDHSPSFRIDREAGLCFCFSGCTPKSLDVIALYARMFSLSQSEATKQLAARL